MKVARAVARIKRGLQSNLQLGSLSGQRDWGWAPDFVRGMWMALQLDTLDDFVLATGKLHRVQDFVEKAFAVVELNWRDYVTFDQALVVATEPVAPCGNPAKAQRLLGWTVQVPFDEMVERLVKSEFDKLS